MLCNQQVPTTPAQHRLQLFESGCGKNGEGHSGQVVTNVLCSLKGEPPHYVPLRGEDITRHRSTDLEFAAAVCLIP